MKKNILLGMVLVFFIFVIMAEESCAARDIWRIYHSSNEVNNILKNLSASYPSLMSYEVIGKSIQGNDIYLFKIGNPNGGKFMFDGRIHGPEDCGTELGLEFIKWVLTSNDADARRVRERNYLLFIPIINTDSIKRQNMRRNYTYPNGTTINIPYGVDLNRNFPTGWGSSGSGDPTNDYDYRGPVAGSEPETQAVLNAMKKYKPNIYMNVHCGSEMLGYDQKTNITIKVLSLITNISARLGVNTNSYYSPGGGGCGGGLACNDGAVYSGGNGWLFESTTWEHLPETLDEFLRVWYPRAFPVYLAMAQAVEKIPVASYCGDGVCNDNESCSTCSNDCGPCLVNNTPPSHATPVLRASDSPLNTTNANLTCYNRSTFDADGDRVVNIYRWYRDSVFVPSLTNKTTVNSNYTLPGQRWVCQVTPFDGKDYGVSLNSSPLFIRNASVAFFCGDGTCNNNENCSSCSRDCGNCTNTSIPKITACRIQNLTWNEDEVFVNAYDLNSCFNDPLNHSLSFISAEKKVINVSISKGIVTLTPPPDWYGKDYVSFRASDGDRIAWTNKALLTVLPMPDCGDGTCEEGENCNTCSDDCGACPKKSNGGGGGGGSLYVYKPLNNSSPGVEEEVKVAEEEVQPEIIEQAPTQVVEEEPEELTVSLNEAIPSSEKDDDSKGSVFFTSSVKTAESRGVVTAAPSNDDGKTESSAVMEEKLTGAMTASPRGLTHSPALLLLVIAFFSLGVFGAYSNFKGYRFDKKQPRVYNHVNELEWDYLSALYEYVGKALEMNYSRERIRSELLNVGWSEGVVNSLLNACLPPTIPESRGVQTELKGFIDKNQ